jgi:hypothetical protein
LTATHPVANAILTIRDPERWYPRIQETNFPILDQMEADGGPGLPGQVIRGHTFDGQLSDRAHCLAIHTEHNRKVQKAIAP